MTVLTPGRHRTFLVWESPRGWLARCRGCAWHSRTFLAREDAARWALAHEEKHDA